MQNLFRLSMLTMTVICANYFSTLAQGQRKAFEEGDKVFSVGVAGAGGSSGFSKMAPSISFDYGLKGTRGIVSIGGFMSYSNSITQSSSAFNPYYASPFDTTTSYNSFTSLKKQSITAGLRLGLHYSTRKWDLYAGAMIGYQFGLSQNHQLVTTSYKKVPNSQFPISNTISKSTSYPLSYHPENIIFSPYVGTRYYVAPKIFINLEAGQHTGNIGIGFKF